MPRIPHLAWVLCTLAAGTTVIGADARQAAAAWGDRFGHASSPSWSSDGTGQPPPPSSVQRALAWWMQVVGTPPPAKLVPHLPEFVTLYVSYEVATSSSAMKGAISFEMWLTLNGVTDATCRRCLVELYRLAENARHE